MLMQPYYCTPTPQQYAYVVDGLPTTLKIDRTGIRSIQSKNKASTMNSSRPSVCWSCELPGNHAT